MDEIMTWREVSDPSLWHLYSAIQHGADGGQPLFYTTAWLWAKVVGTSVLDLRLYSAVAISAAMVVTWRTLRRFYGMWATAFGVLAFWGTSGALLDQNAEARFYGLYLLATAITLNIYARLVNTPAASRLLLTAAFLSQVALVFSHVLGVIYGGLILLALILVDAANGRLRLKTYAAYVAGWFALILWLPAIRASMAAGRPHGWIKMPTLTDVRTAYLFADSLPWLRYFKRHSMELGFQSVSRTAELVIYLSLAGVLLLSIRALFRNGWRTLAKGRGPLILAAFALLLAPFILFALSHLVAPVFAPRYLLPSGIGLAIVLTASADHFGADRLRQTYSLRPLWVILVLFFMTLPVLTVRALESPATSWAYLNVDLLEESIPPGTPLVAAWLEDFLKLMRLSHGDQSHYFFLLDWPGAQQGPRSFVLSYNLMRAYRESGYFADQIAESNDFLCTHPDFLVLNSPNATPLSGGDDDLKRPNWFDWNIRNHPQFTWKEIGSFDGTEVTRRLIAVHRTGPLPFCKGGN
jgi:hypothetical protein